MAEVSKLSSENHGPFLEACGSVRARLIQAVDLVLIHNERDVRGNQPRASLNPLIVLLSVSAWERLIIDIDHLASGRKWPGPNLVPGRSGISYPAKAFRMLSDVTGGALPDSMEITIFQRYRGKTPNSAVVTAGSDPLVSEELSGWIATRNGVAHHCLPQQNSDVDERKPRIWRSDAEGSDGFTVQAGGARACLSFMIQLVDQVSQSIAAESGFDFPESKKLPNEWFSVEPGKSLRGVDDPGVFWGGTPLSRPATT